MIGIAVRRKEVLRVDQMCSQVGSAVFLRASLRDLHVNRRHRGRLVDVTSLGMSVVDWHRRMEGGEELRCSCMREKEKKKQHMRRDSLQFVILRLPLKTYCHVKSFPSSANLNSSYNERQWLMAIFQQTHPNWTSLNPMN